MKTGKLILPFAFILCIICTFQAKSQQWGLYTLYAPKNGIKAYLIDTANTPVTFHTWTFSSSQKTVYSTYLLPGDTILRNYKPSGNTWNTGPVHGGIQKVTYGGTIAWDWQYFQNGSYCPHHDMTPMPNGNVLLICYEAKSAAEAVQAGYASSEQIYSEKIVEVHPTGLNTGTIVWEWHLWDHLCQNHNSAKDNYVTSIVNNPQLLNINYAGTGMAPDKFHMNGIDYNPTLDQIVVSMHFMNSVFVIDHSTTTAEAAGHTGGNSGKGGDFLYRWGNPASYSAPGSVFFNVVHDAHWVPSDNPNYPGYLCGFNNNSGSGNSKVEIWNPPYSGSNYTLNVGQAYEPASPAYEFTSVFTSNNEGNSQQLPNGNMLVNNSFGSIYEINAAGTQLWTKAGANSSHAYRFTLCEVRGPMVTCSTSETQIAPGIQITLNSSALSVTETSPEYSYEWSSNPPGFTSYDPSTMLTPSVSSTYTVTITNTALGCSSTASVTVAVDANGVNETAGSGGLACYPNPSSGLIHIAGSETLNQEYEIIVFDNFGKMVLKEQNPSELDLFEYPDGIYLLRMKTEGKTVSQKVLLLK